MSHPVVLSGIPNYYACGALSEKSGPFKNVLLSLHSECLNNLLIWWTLDPSKTDVRLSLCEVRACYNGWWLCVMLKKSKKKNEGQCLFPPLMLSTVLTFCAVALCLHLWCGRNTTVETDWSRAHSEQEIKLLTNWIRNGWPGSRRFHVLRRHMDRRTKNGATHGHTDIRWQVDMKVTLWQWQHLTHHSDS